MQAKPICSEVEVPKDELIISHTNLHGTITYVNETFSRISGYDTDELLGQPHNIVRHPDMPASLFANLWETINEGKIWSGYVKNLRKDGGFYWVYAQVSQLFDRDGHLIGYKSLRAPVEQSKRFELQKNYSRLKEMEEGLVKLDEWVDIDTYRKLMTLSLTKEGSIARVLKELLEE